MFDTPDDTAVADAQDSTEEPLDSRTAYAVRAILIKLADAQDRIAAREAALVPYWKSCPESVIGPRAAARALRATAELMFMPAPWSAH
jgi:hypothetical protein